MDNSIYTNTANFKFLPGLFFYFSKKLYEHITFSVNYMSQHKPRVIEGELRIDELVKHLEKFNSPKTVWLSEDGSGIVSKVAYDSSTNQSVGVVLPTDSNTRFPISFCYTT